MTTGFCKTNGITTHYHRTGGNKPSVVLLHGLMTSGACLTQLAHTLEKKFDVISLIDVLDLKSPVLVGHSMGAMTAAVVASQYHGQLSGLVLADPPFLSLERQQEVYESDVVNQHRQILSQSKDDYITRLRARHIRRSAELIKQFAEARFQTSLQALEILKPAYPDCSELIKSLKIRALLVIGGLGGIISTEFATELAALNQLLAVEQIKEAGHAIPFDQPERFSNVVQAFLLNLVHEY